MTTEITSGDKIITFANNQTGAFALRLEDLENKQTGIFGMAGGGKTNTACVLIEQALAQGYGVTTIGLRPEAGFIKSGLDARTTIITAEMVQTGTTTATDQETRPAQLQLLAAQLATQSVESGMPVAFLSGWGEWWDEGRNSNLNDQVDFLQQYVESLLAARQRQLALAGTGTTSSSTPSPQQFNPYFIFVDEADVLLPDATNEAKGFSRSSQSKERLKETLLQLSEQGRRVGVTLIYLCQYPANLDIELLRTTTNFIFHRLTHSQIGEMLPPHVTNTANEQQSFFGNLWRERADPSLLAGEKTDPIHFPIRNQADTWDRLAWLQRGQAFYLSSGQLGTYNRYIEVELSQTAAHFINHRRKMLEENRFQGTGNSPEGSLEQWLSTARKFGTMGNSEET